MKPILNAQQMREHERIIFESISSYQVMENAARAFVDYLVNKTSPCKVLVVCGNGNNGGDGYAIARLLREKQYSPVILRTAGDLSGDARTNYGLAKSRQIPMFDSNHKFDCEFVIDALFGIGLNRNLGEEYLSIISLINSYPVVYSVDIPSGINAGTGEIMGAAVNATCTITFAYPKIGHMLFPGREYCGELVIAPIVPDELQFKTTHDIELIENTDLQNAFPPRRMNSYKGNYGRALLFGGSVGYCGAVAIAAKAALRTGTGLLSLGVDQKVASSVWSLLPEAMVHPFTLDTMHDLIAGKTCIGAGPGWVDANREMILQLLDSGLPCVLDAAALNLIAQCQLHQRLHKNIVLTPHAGEMSRLTGLPVKEILAHPIEIARQFAVKHNCSVLLKGATSIITDGAKTYLNRHGNTSLAKGGSGDILCGIILGLLALGNSPLQAAMYGALLLGLCAESVKMPPQCVIPTDLVNAIPMAIQFNTNLV